MFRLINNLARGTKTSLCSKRFRLVSELNETVEGDFRFWSPEKLNENQKMNEGEERGRKETFLSFFLSFFLSVLSSPPPPLSFTWLRGPLCLLWLPARISWVQNLQIGRLTALKQHLVNWPFSPRLFCLFLFCFVYIYIYFSGDSTPIRLLVELATTLKY